MAELAVALLALFAHMERIFMREHAAHARAALAANQSVKQVAAASGASHTTLYRHLSEHNN